MTTFNIVEDLGDGESITRGTYTATTPAAALNLHIESVVMGCRMVLNRMVAKGLLKAEPADSQQEKDKGV